MHTHMLCRLRGALQCGVDCDLHFELAPARGVHLVGQRYVHLAQEVVRLA